MAGGVLLSPPPPKFNVDCLVHGKDGLPKAGNFFLKGRCTSPATPSDCLSSNIELGGKGGCAQCSNIGLGGSERGALQHTLNVIDGCRCSLFDSVESDFRDSGDGYGN